jgi:hypothetical protein
MYSHWFKENKIPRHSSQKLGRARTLWTIVDTRENTALCGYVILKSTNFAAVFTTMKYLLHRIVLFLGSLHLSLMAALGIWLWSNPAAFGPAGPGPNSSGHAASEPCAIDMLTVIVLGKHIPLGSSGLRAASIAIYSPFLIPGLNLILPACLFLGTFIAVRTYDRRCMDNGNRTGPSTVHLHPAKTRGWFTHLRPILPAFIGLVILFSINLVLTVNIELTLRQNRGLQDASESSWTFGQILALLLLALPLRDLVKTIVDRQEKRHKKELERQEKHQRTERKKDQTALLERALRRNGGPEMRELRDLVLTGANADIRVHGMSIYPCIKRIYY